MVAVLPLAGAQHTLSGHGSRESTTSAWGNWSVSWEEKLAHVTRRKAGAWNEDGRKNSDPCKTRELLRLKA
eukprot:1184727-Rhodomonas_salina.1